MTFSKIAYVYRGFYGRSIFQFHFRIEHLWIYTVRKKVCWWIANSCLLGYTIFENTWYQIEYYQSCLPLKNGVKSTKRITGNWDLHVYQLKLCLCIFLILYSIKIENMNASFIYCSTENNDNFDNIRIGYLLQGSRQGWIIVGFENNCQPYASKHTVGYSLEEPRWGESKKG